MKKLVQISTGVLPLVLLFSIPCVTHACADEIEGSYLIVQPSAEQPDSSNLGTVVLVQAEGGTRLRLRVEGGTHRSAGFSDLRESSCLPYPNDGTTVSFTVLPKESEALLYVDLLGATDPDAGVATADADAGSLDPFDSATCVGVPVKSVIVPITTVRNNQKADTSSTTTSGSSTSTSTSTTTTSSSTTTGSSTGSGVGGMGGLPMTSGSGGAP